MVSMGGSISAFIAASGFVYVCGAAADGALCVDEESKDNTTELKGKTGARYLACPRLISELSAAARRVSAGPDFVMVGTKGGRLYVWGNGRTGSLGIGRQESMSQPYLVKKFRAFKVKKVMAAPYHCAALTEAGTMFSWGGAGGVGQKGLKHIGSQLTPVETFRLKGYRIDKAAVGPSLTVCLTTKDVLVDLMGLPAEEEILPNLEAYRTESAVGSKLGLKHLGVGKASAPFVLLSAVMAVCFALWLAQNFGSLFL